MDRFVAAARLGENRAAAAVVSGREPAFAARAAVWAANLHRIDWSTQSWRVQPRAADLSAARRQVLGGDAWVQEVRIAWSLAGEASPSQNSIWLTFVDGLPVGGPPGVVSTTRLAGDSDGPAPAEAMPLWLQQPLELQRSGPVLLLAAGRDGTDWLGVARAAQRVAETRTGAAGRDTSGVLVVGLPQSRAVFERSLGVPSGSYAAVAAAAWPMADTANPPIHVLVNPEASSRLSRLGRDVLLTHEAVHVVTRSPASPAPTWLVEGYADQIAYQAYPAGRGPAERAVREAVRGQGLPDDWPSEQDFAPDAPGLDLGYDLAWTAARSIADSYGDAGLNRLYATVDRGESLEDAAAGIGTTEHRLLQRWRADLRRMAAR